MLSWKASFNTFRAKASSMPPMAEARIIAAVAVVIAALLLLMLVLPPYSYSAIYTNDLLIFYDNAHRILQGQVPNRDIYTPMGPLSFLLPAFGLWLGGSLGDMMPIATAAFTIVLTPLLVYACASRLPLAYALPAILFTLFLVVAPVNVGDPADQITFAMFYNRFGYAMLSILFLLPLPRKESVGNWVVDAALAALLLLLMFYIKISYALVGAAFILGLMLVPHMRKAAAASILMAIAGVLLIELFWRGTSAYFEGIRLAGEATGPLRGSLFTLARVVVENFTGCLLFLLVLGIAFARGARLEILILCACMAAAGVLLFNQNAQYNTILLLVPAALVAALAPAREGPPRAARPRLASVVALVALAVPPTLLPAAALAYFAARSSQPPGSDAFAEELRGVVAREGHLVPFKPGILAQRAAYRDQKFDIDMFNMARQTRMRQPLGQSEYLATIKDGAELLRSRPELQGKVFVFDMANPFNALLDRPAPGGADAWHHAGRTFTEASHRPAEQMLRDVDVVLLPKAPMELATNQLMRQLYGPYLQREFELAATSDYWFAYRRRAGAPAVPGPTAPARG